MKPRAIQRDLNWLWLLDVGAWTSEWALQQISVLLRPGKYPLLLLVSPWLWHPILLASPGVGMEESKFICCICSGTNFILMLMLRFLALAGQHEWQAPGPPVKLTCFVHRLADHQIALTLHHYVYTSTTNFWPQSQLTAIVLIGTYDGRHMWCPAVRARLCLIMNRSWRYLLGVQELYWRNTSALFRR